jgi:hypothetical protein
MRLVSVIFIFLFLPILSGTAQKPPEEVVQMNKYLLSAKGPSGELIITTGRIVKAIALSRPQSMEIANVWVNYSVSVALSTDRDGSTTARVSFKDLHLTGDVKFKGFDITNFIFPSCVSFKLSSSGSGRSKPLLANVREAAINPGNCTISVSLGKNVTEVPAIEKLCFFHSESDYETATSQIKLIERYFTATWLMHRTEHLMDAMQFSQLKNPSAFIASNIEVALLNDWISRQRFDKYPYFQKIDSLMFTKQILVNRYKRNLIEHDFAKVSTITKGDLSNAAALFSESLSNYFSAGQGDIIRSAYLTQMAGSSMTHIGYKELLDFVEIYNATHPHQLISQRDIVAFSAEIEMAMIQQAAKLVDNEKYSEAMNMLKTSDRYSLLLVDQQSPFENELTSHLSQRLYIYYLDIAVKAMQGNVFRVSTDYYRKALAIKQQYPDKVKSDPRERYIADMTCKNILQTAERSYQTNDMTSALAGFEEVIKLADSARLKNSYEAARLRLQAISGRPSGYRPWVGQDLAVAIPKEESEVIKSQPKREVADAKEPLISRRQKRVTPVNDIVNQPKIVDSTALVTKLSKKQMRAQQRNVIDSDNARILASEVIKPGRNDRNKPNRQPVNTLSKGFNRTRMNVETTNDQSLRDRLRQYVDNIHMKIWAGDIDSSLIMLNAADSLQEILSKNGDNGFLVDLKSSRINYNNLICDQQKTIYNKDFEQIKLLLKQKEFAKASTQLKLLIAKSFNAECAVDKTSANQLLGSLDAPIVFRKWKLQLDSLTLTQEPEVIIEAFAKANDYYRTNGLDKWGIESPDLLVALQTRKETAFLLKASLQFVNNHQPAYALTLLKSIALIEPKPDKTLSLQKRVGELLASGDYTAEKSITDKLTAYGLDERWFAVLVTAYKKQWKVFSN